MHFLKMSATGATDSREDRFDYINLSLISMFLQNEIYFSLAFLMTVHAERVHFCNMPPAC